MSAVQDGDGGVEMTALDDAEADSKKPALPKKSAGF